MTLAACGIAPEDVAGTYVYDEGAKYTATCTPDLGTNGETSLAGQQFVLSVGTESDLIIEGGDCDTLLNIEGGELVKAGTVGDCEAPTYEGMTVTVSGGYTMSWADGVITVGGTESAKADYTDESLTDYQCDYTLSGTATRQ